jgi:aminodeoxyfutalosine synthase
VNINTAIAERARAGEALTVAEIDELGSSDVLSLGMLADEVRRARVGDTVTYVRVIEMAGGAGGAGGAGEAGGAGGAVEMRLSSLPATLDEAEGLLAEARMLAGPQLLTGFSLADIVDRQWGKLVDVLKRLKRAGLDAIVEAPVDRLHDAENALRACDEAELPVRCLSLQSPIEGDGRSSWLIHLRDLVQKFPNIDTVNPLSREQSIAVPTTGYDDVRAVALARLALPSVKNIQVDWAQYGPKLAQVALTFGANDLDRVSTLDDESLGRRRTSVEDVRRNIAAAGFNPVERAATK